MSLEQFRELGGQMVRGARQIARHSMPADLPDRAETPGQEALKAKHGTPAEFAEACVQAVGEVSINAAVAAVEKYLAEWKAA